MYAITGATGNTGKVIASRLLEAGKKVRVIGRNKERLLELQKKGAEIAVGDLSDESFLAKAFQGAVAIYSMIPPNMQVTNYREYQNNVTDSTIAAAKKAGVKYVVTLSSVGAHLPEKGGVVQGLFDMEQKWNKEENTHVLHLRPSYFMENTLGQVELIKTMGIMGSPIKGDIKFPMIASHDIGEKAAQKLLDLNFSGKSAQYLLGANDVSYNEVAEIYGKTIGKPDLQYVQFSYEDGKKAMMEGWGLNENGADTFIEFMKSLNEGKIMEDAKRSEANTTPTSIQDFTQTFSYVYNM